MYIIKNKYMILKNDGTYLPVDEKNRDYQEYLKWIAEGNKPEIDPKSFLKIVEYPAIAEHWSKEGEDDRTEEPFTEPSWSNGVDTVYDQNDIPTTLDENNDPVLDDSYEYVPQRPDPTWTHHEAVEATWEIVEDQEAIDKANAEQALKSAVQNAIGFGNRLLVDFAAENMKLGITQDGMTKTVRKAMSEIVLALQTGSLYDAIDEIDAIPAESKDDKYITDERLAEYKKRIQDYLGL